MKKLLLVLLALMVLGAAGGAAWWKFGHRPDHLALGRQAMQSGDLRAAALELRGAVRDTPDNEDAHFRLGYSLLQLGDAVAAQKELETAQSLGGKHDDLPVLLAQCYLLQGNNKQLLEQFKPPMPTADMTAQLLLIRALALASLGDQPGALAALSTAEAASPRSASVPLTAARIAMGQNNLLLAQEKVDRALLIDPRRVDGMLLKAQILNARGNRSAALSVLDTAVATAPRFLAARLERANIELDLGMDEKTRVDLDEITKQQPNATAAIYLNAVLLTRAKKSAQADLEFQKISTVLERFPRAYFFVGVVKLDLGQIEQALDNATRYNSRHPADIDGVKLLATAQLAAKKPELAIATLLKSQRFGLSDSETLNLLSQAYIAAGKPGEASRSLDRALAVAPATKPGGRGLLGGVADARDLPSGIRLSTDERDPDRKQVVTAIVSGDLEGASKALDNLRIQQGPTEDVGMLRAAIMILRQEYDGARRQYLQLSNDSPNSLRPRLGLAELNVIQGRNEDAENILTQILDQDPANEAALNALLPIYSSTGRAARGVTVLEAAFTAAPGNAKIGLTLATFYVETNQSAKALKTLDLLIPAGGAASEPQLLVRAHALERDRRFEDALEVYRQLLIRTPGAPQIVSEMMAVQQSLNDYDGARKTAQAALLARPKDTMLLRLLVGNELFRGGEAGANAEIDTLEKSPDTAETAAMLRADLAMALRKYAVAADLYYAQVKQHPNSELVASTAIAAASARLSDRAETVMDEWLAQTPDDVRVLHLDSDLKIANGKIDAAVAMLEKLNSVEADNPTTMNNLAWFYAIRKDPRALPMAQRAFVLQPSAANADTLGWILVQTGQAAKAVPLLAQAAAVIKTDPSVQYHYAYALGKSGRKGEALTIMRPLAEQEASFPEQEDARRMVKELRDGN